MSAPDVEPEPDGADHSAKGGWTMTISPPKTGAVGPAVGAEGGPTRLRVQQFAERTVLDFGKVDVGSSKTLYLELENATAVAQELSAQKVPVAEGFRLGEGPALPPAASLAWKAHLQPGETLALPVTWTPARIGAAAQSLGLRLDGKHSLQIRLVGSAAAPVATKAKPRVASGLAGARPAATAAGASSAQQGGFKIPAARPPSAKAAAGDSAGGSGTASSLRGPPARAPPSQRPGSALTSTLRLKRAPSAGTGPSDGGGADGRGADDQRAAGQPETPRGQLVHHRLPPSAPGSPISPATATGGHAAGPRPSTASSRLPRVSSSGLSSSGGGGAGSVSSASRIGRAPSVAGSVSRRSSPGRASVRDTPGSTGGSSTSKKARKTFSFFHTELWMQKQDKAFSSWLNHLLAPSEQHDGSTGGAAAAAAGATASAAAAALNERRLAAVMQGALVACYRRDDDLRDTMMRVEGRIDQGQLRLRDEALQFGDVAVRDRTLAVLLSYHPFWLRLGLEVVTQRAVGTGVPHSLAARRASLSGRAPEDDLRSFLMDHFLGDQDLAREAEAARGAAHYDTAEHWRDLGEVVLKRFLLLALLLDKVASKASEARAPTPLLFRVDSTIKSTGEAVHEFLHGRLLGEGNLLRHLELLGYKPRYKQSPLAEYPYAVTNLAVDLRDGLRLVRLAELLADAPGLSEQARFPADRRPLALHNVSLALSALRSAGVPLDAVPTARGLAALRAEEIVDGDRDRSLALLWAAARALQLPRLLRPATLRAEVARVLARGRRAAAPGAAAARRGQVPLTVYMNDELACLLMEWSQAVCLQYGVEVANFTTCFGDGRVLCLLVAYYLPNALDASEIYAPDPTPTADDGSSGLAVPPPTDETLRPGGWCAMFDAGGCVVDAAAERHKAGVARNFAAVHRAARCLGAVPEMLSASDWAEHGPDERAVMLYVAFLCSRLLDCSREDRAAHVIQSAWRDARARQSGAARANLHAWVAAATVVTRAARAWLFRRAVGRMLAETRAKREAAVVLQAAWRGRAVRAELALRSAAATRIQRAWRIARVTGRRGRAAATIQAAWRGHVARREVACRRRMRCAAAAIQAAWRMHAARGAFVELRAAAEATQSLARSAAAARLLAGLKAEALARRREAAAVAIQSGWRGATARRAYASDRAAITCLQALARGAAVRRDLAKRHAAAARIQAAYKGHMVRQVLRASSAFATFLQACYRSRRARVAFLRLRAAAVEVQAARRGVVARRAFVEARSAAIVLQAAWRGAAVRRELAAQHAAATAIQSAWRMHAAQAQLAHARAAAVKVQAAWRMASARATFAQQRAAIVVLQAAWRGAAVRADVARRHAAATRIQAAWRMHAAQGQLVKARAAAMAIQAWWRMELASQAFARQRAAIVVLQAAWRGAAVRADVARRHAAATRIQAAWRMHAAQGQLVKARAAAVAIQAWWRMEAASQAFARQRAAIVVLQAAWRGAAVRKEVARQHAAATEVQAVWRMHAARQRFVEQRAAAVVLQSAARGAAARRALWQQRAAACTLQRAWRCREARALLAAHRAAALIQSCVRGWSVRRRLALLAASATRIQAAWRGHVAQLGYQQQRAAAVVLQAAWRGAAVRKELAAQHAAATRIQAAWRMHAAQTQLEQARAAATAVQAWWRMAAASKALEQQRAAAGVLQRSWRCHTACQLLTEHKAAARLQAAWRGACVRQQLRAQHAAATRVQAGWRMHVARAQFLECRGAAVTLQAAVRGALARAALRQQIAAAVALQSAWRGAAVRMEQRRQAAAATAMQAAWRSFSARSAFLRVRAAVVTMQSTARMAPVRAAFVDQRAAAVLLQSAWRGAAARAHAQRMRAAVEIQRVWRGYAVRQELQRRSEAALCLQCAMRGLLARRQAQAVRDYLRSASEFQRMLMELHHRTMAATLIQSAWRARVERRAFAPVWEAHQEAKARQAAAATIQRAWRAHCFRGVLQQRLAARATIVRHLPMMRARMQLTRTRRAALALQAAWRLQAARRAAAAVALQAAVRGWLARRRAARAREAAVRIQAAWRGHRVRRRAGRSGREARARLEAAAAAAQTAPHKRIGARAREALRVLLASKQCAQVIAAVGAIEFSTRYSKECCALIAESGGVAALLAFMRSCNRSKPHAEMLRLALAALHNVARWRDLAPSVLDAPECVAVLSERLQMFRDMEDIFLSVVSLLSKLTSTDEGALSVAKAAAPGALRQWEGVATIIGRKIDMERKYIARLEGQKGSDASAREATRKMVAGAKQLEALSAVIRRVTEVGEAAGIQIVHQPPPGASGSGAGSAGGSHHMPGHLGLSGLHGQSGGGLGSGDDDLPPLDVVAHPEAAGHGGAGSAYKFKNTIVRGVLRTLADQNLANVAARDGPGGGGAADKGGGGSPAGGGARRGAPRGGGHM